MFSIVLSSRSRSSVEGSCWSKILGERRGHRLAGVRELWRLLSCRGYDRGVLRAKDVVVAVSALACPEGVFREGRATCEDF